MRSDLRLRRRHQELKIGAGGFRWWEVVEEERSVAPERVAIIVCDVWDRHWSRGANQRVAGLVPRMARVINRSREREVSIIHAPSETMEFYRDSPARHRAREIPRIEPPPFSDHLDPPLPIDASDGGSDTGETSWYRAWTRQHPAITIDEERDLVSDDGGEVYSFLRGRAIEEVLILGVHANMCVLDRSFAIKALVRQGISVSLVRDLTDAMYNPERPPYVSHDEGTRLVVEFIEKFWAPTCHSSQLLD